MAAPLGNGFKVGIEIPPRTMLRAYALTPDTVELIPTLGALFPRGGSVQDSVLTLSHNAKPAQRTDPTTAAGVALSQHSDPTTDTTQTPTQQPAVRVIFPYVVYLAQSHTV